MTPTENDEDKVRLLGELERVTAERDSLRVQLNEAARLLQAGTFLKHDEVMLILAKAKLNDRGPTESL